MRGLAAVLVALASLFGALPASVAAGDGPGFHVEEVAAGLGRPTYVTAPPNDPLHLYVVGQRGIVRVFERATTADPWAATGNFLDMRARVKGPYVGRGLLGMAFDPAYDTNGLFYVFFTRRPDGAIVIARYRSRDALHAATATRRVVLTIAWPSAFHFGGWIGFGPDGYMYMTTGDATDIADAPSQDPDTLIGKALRFNPHVVSGKPGFVPADNPFVGGDPADDLVWATGTRNPWRASFDTSTGALWLPDVGQSSYEEINRFEPYTAGAGANLGWPLCEGAHAYPPAADDPEPCTASGTVTPLLEYPHSDGNCSVIGGYVYRGSAQPALIGRYFFGDYCTGNIWSIPHGYSSGDLGEPFVVGQHITSFGVDALGELYFVTGDGALWRVVQDAID